MRLHLVSLALLLLALCRPSSSSILSWTTATTNKAIADVPTDSTKHEAEALTIDGMTKALFAALGDAIPNSLYFVFLKNLNKYDNLPPFYKAALDNGVLCEQEPETIKAVNKVVYPTAGTAGAPNDAERAAVDGINCADNADKNKPENKCFCGTPQKPKIMCAIKEAMKGVIPATAPAKQCKADAIKALLAEASEFGKNFEDDGTKINTLVGKKDAKAMLDDKEGARRGKFFCDVLKPGVKDLVKAVYAADASLWTQEFIVSAVLDAASGYPEPTDPKAVCESDFKDSEFGKCMCPLENGILGYCFPYLIAEKLKTAKYIDCTDPDVPGLHEEIVIAVAELEVLKPAKSDVTKTPGNATDTTTEPSSAATSSLLLAAAVVLLGQ